MFKRLILSASVVAASLTAQAQINAFKFNQRGGGFNVTVGGFNSNFDKIYDNYRLEKVVGNSPDDLLGGPGKFEKPSNLLPAIGIGGYGVSSSIIFGGELNFYGGTTASKDYSFTALEKPLVAEKNRKYTLKTNFMAVDALATFGVIVLSSKHFAIYPLIGVGYGASAVRLRDDKDNRQYPFYTLVGDNGNKENMFISNQNVVLDFSVNADFYLGGGKSDESKGFKLGVRVGYRNQLASFGYKANYKSIQDNLEDNDLAKNPVFYSQYDTKPITSEEQIFKKLGNSGPYVKLTIGVGNLKKKR